MCCTHVVLCQHVCDLVCQDGCQLAIGQVHAVQEPVVHKDLKAIVRGNERVTWFCQSVKYPAPLTYWRPSASFPNMVRVCGVTDSKGKPAHGACPSNRLDACVPEYCPLLPWPLPTPMLLCMACSICPRTAWLGFRSNRNAASADASWPGVSCVTRRSGHLPCRCTIRPRCGRPPRRW